jgi:hypothetical protein
MMMTVLDSSHCCDKLLEKFNLKGEMISFDSWFQRFQPWLAGSIAFKLMMR